MLPRNQPQMTCDPGNVRLIDGIDFNAQRNFRVLGFSDTYGIDVGNGVARFLHDLRDLTTEHRLPLELVVPARDEITFGLISIRAPSFSVPGYGELKISMPLRHHRKNIERHIKETRPDCLHVSTPGPFGCFGVTLAKRYRLPLVGIYHTDFISYVRAIVVSQLDNLRSDPRQIFGMATAKVLPVIFPLLSQIGKVNPQAMKQRGKCSRDWSVLMTTSRLPPCSASPAAVGPVPLDTRMNRWRSEVACVFLTMVRGRLRSSAIQGISIANTQPAWSPSFLT